MRDEVRFLSAVVALMLFAGCARSGEPSGSNAGGPTTGAATTPPPATASSAPASADGASAATAAPKVAFTLFQNVRIFDGKSEVLSGPSNVLLKDNTIERISVSPITVEANANVRVIAADGRVLMPGLIDAHRHAFMAATPQMGLMTADDPMRRLKSPPRAGDHEARPT